MSWRNVIISNPAKLSCKQRALLIRQDADYRVPLEDICSIVIDNPQVLITQPVLSICAEYGISIFSTDSSHIPNGIFLPFVSHNSPLKLIELQIGVAKPTVKRIWSQIVKAKINNQALCLKLSESQGCDYLQSLKANVRSGDPKNTEARAAAFYFKQLFSKEFARSFEDNSINGRLNYGYAIFRGEISRRIVAHGLYPPLGIFHSNYKNPFNLSDDLIEAFRPVVDLFVKEFERIEPNSKDIPKAKLVNLLNYEVITPRGKMAVSLAMENLVESYVRVLKGMQHDLELPIIEALQLHEYDESLL